MAEADLNALELFRASLVLRKQDELSPPQPYDQQITDAIHAGTMDAEGCACLLAFALQRWDQIEAINAEALSVLRRAKTARFPNEHEAVGRDAIKALQRYAGEEA